MSIKVAVTPNDILSTTEVCELLGITRQTLYSWMDQNRIKPWKRTGGGATWIFLRWDAEKLKGKKYKLEPQPNN
ncbi:MAG: helix-turn-helix domain-containing protein [Elusimicrobia bacterium]|nr:helix-turn-helix domain-containing protein [Elusimicrobiota bacterium]